MTNNDGGPAFPRSEWDDLGNCVVMREGMSLRDWFAGQALIAMMGHRGFSESGDALACAELCYELADAMLRAREATDE